MSAKDKELARLQKKLSKMRMPEPPEHPLLNKENEADRIREHDARALASWERWEREDVPHGSSSMPKPLTLGQQWAQYKREAPLRRWIQQQAGRCSKGEINTTKLYQILAERVQVKKRSDLNAAERRRLHDSLHEYLKRLWEFCHVSRKPSYYFAPARERKMGSEHYQYWLEYLHEYKRIQDMIAAVEGR